MFNMSLHLNFFCQKKKKGNIVQTHKTDLHCSLSSNTSGTHMIKDDFNTNTNFLHYES